MRLLVGVLLLALSLPLAAQQAGTVTFDVPSSGGAPTSYRLFRDGTLVGNLTPGQTITALFPSSAGSWVIGVEAVNATGAGPRVNRTVTLGPPLPGPVRNLNITLSCSTATPPTCSVTVVDAP